MYFNGTGALQNYVTAHMWFNIAAANGAEDAGSNREAVAKKMTPEQIGKAQQMAAGWMAAHANKE